MFGFFFFPVYSLGKMSVFWLRSLFPSPGAEGLWLLKEYSPPEFQEL